jgi:hypothetical protein
MARPSRDPDLMRRVVIDAEHLGDEAAAKKHGVSTKTVQRYRAATRTDTKLSEAVQAEKLAMMGTWREQLREARQKLLGRVMELSAEDKNLFHVSGALKIVNDAENAAHVIATLDGGADDGRRGEPGTGGLVEGPTVEEAPRRALALLTSRGGR